jgi:hypothetical protein
VLQGGPCRPSVGCVIRIGDGEMLDASIRQRSSQVAEVAISFQAGAVRSEQNDAADRVERTAVPRQALVRKLEDKVLVRRQEHLEGRAVFELRLEVAGGAEGNLDFLVGVLLEPLGDLSQRELEIGGSSDGRGFGSPCQVRTQ